MSLVARGRSKGMYQLNQLPYTQKFLTVVKFTVYDKVMFESA